MSGDPFAADPCAMGLPGYRVRYYEAHFPRARRGPGDLEKAAAAACGAYLDTMAWVYRCVGWGGVLRSGAASIMSGLQLWALSGA